MTYCGCCGLVEEGTGDGYPVCDCTDACAEADNCLRPNGRRPLPMLKRACAYCDNEAVPGLPHHNDWPVCADHVPDPAVIQTLRAVCVHDDGFEHPSDGTLPCPDAALLLFESERTVLAEQLEMVDDVLRRAGYQGGPRQELMYSLLVELLELRGRLGAK